MEYKIVSNTLPVMRWINGHCVWFHNMKITCSPFGEMSDGTMVWADEDGNQFLKQKHFGRYFFCEF